MDTIKILDEKNYDPHWKRNLREAVRAVIIQGNQVAMVKSLAGGYYKFPGGGIEQGETRMEALHRETMEEAGLKITSDKEYGMVHEIRRDLYKEEIFEQKSYYYMAETDENSIERGFSGCELESGSIPEWVSLQKAYEDNMRLSQNMGTAFLLREVCVLKLLIESGEQW